MDKGKKEASGFQQLVVDVAKQLSKVRNTHVLIQPPSNGKHDGIWTLDIDGVGRVQFDPSAKLGAIPFTVAPPVPRPGRSKKGANSGAESAGSASPVSS